MSVINFRTSTLQRRNYPANLGFISLSLLLIYLSNSHFPGTFRVYIYLSLVIYLSDSHFPPNDDFMTSERVIDPDMIFLFVLLNFLLASEVFIALAQMKMVFQATLSHIIDLWKSDC